MKLKRLIIHGFKSFKDKTVIHFDHGITGIVGPNGCGKSNIVDALFWVMGEQSAKHLRGTKMQDLIFSGSSKYSPAHWAEVSLVLSNDEGKHINIGQKLVKPTEIQISRKLYKNGETEYRINGFPCRLRDIHEVFMDTGAGAKSYSIIAQGEINRLVQAKPIERRAMIEEVAGVTKFKARKKESLRKIENTKLNLERLQDLETEIYKQLQKLKSQSEKAHKAKKLRDRIRSFEVELGAQKEYEYLTSLVDLELKSHDAELNIAQLKGRKDEIEISLEAERIQKDEFLELINGLQKNFNNTSQELAAQKERILHLEESLYERRRELERNEKEIDEGKAQLESRKSRLVEVEKEREALEKTNFSERNFKELEKSLSLLEVEKKKVEKQAETLGEEEVNLGSDLSEIEKEIAKTQVQMNECSSSLDSLTMEIENLEGEISSYQDALSGDKINLEETLSKKKKLEQNLESIKQEFKQKKDLWINSERDLNECLKTEIKFKSQLNSLHGLKEKELLKDKSHQVFFQKFDLKNSARLGDMLETEDRYSGCVELLLEEWLGLILSTEDIDSWARENPDLSLKYSTKIEESGDEVASFEEGRNLSEIISIKNSNFEKQIKNFLKGFYIVDDLVPSLVERASMKGLVKGLVSADGQKSWTRTHGLIIQKSRGKASEFSGMIQRNNEIRNLERKISQITQDAKVKKEKHLSLERSIKSLEGQIEVLVKSLNKCQGDFLGQKSSLEARERFFKNHSIKLDDLIKRKSDLSSKKLLYIEKEESLEKRKEEARIKRENIHEKIIDVKELRDSLQERFQEKRETFISQKTQIETLISTKENLSSNLSDIRDQVFHYEEKISFHEKRKAELTKGEEETSLKIEQERSSYADRERENSLLDLKISQNQKDIEALLSQMQERENQVLEINDKVNNFEKQYLVSQTKIEQIIGDEQNLVIDIFDKYNKNLRSFLVPHIENISPKVLEKLANVGEIENILGEEFSFERMIPSKKRDCEKRLQKSKREFQQMGEVNWEAVEDYERQKKRHEFLKSQEDELKKSLEDLEEAINHIDKKSKARFKEAFEEVNSRFVKVFPIIFGGGDASLKLVGEQGDDLEAGIDIIARPPGKKMQNINLMSGGEKAMTAVSLIFSIFLVKPSPFCLLDEVDAPLDDANVGRFNELLREMSSESQFILITHNKKTMELNDVLYGVTMQEPGISKAISVQLH